MGTDVLIANEKGVRIRFVYPEIRHRQTMEMSSSSQTQTQLVSGISRASSTTAGPIDRSCVKRPASTSALRESDGSAAYGDL
eukprot:2232735-Pyramimonas_sp.AAC.1